MYWDICTYFFCTAIFVLDIVYQTNLSEQNHLQNYTFWVCKLPKSANLFNILRFCDVFQWYQPLWDAKKQNTCRRKVKLDTSLMNSKFRLIFYTWFFCWFTYLVSDLFDLYRLYLASTLPRLGGNETQSHVYAFLNRSR